MVYIIIAIVAFLIVKKLITSSVRGIVKFVKTIFFKPSVNSVLTIILTVCFLFSKEPLFNDSLQPLCKVLWWLCIADCLRDLAVSESYYDCRVEFMVDKLYAIKSVTSIFTLGMSRGIFLLVVGPLIHHSVKQSLHERVNSGQLVSPYSPWRSIKAQDYYYDQELEKLVQNGELVSNENTLREEVARSTKKLDKFYPKTWRDKILDAIAGDEEKKEQRANSRVEIKRWGFSRGYLSKDAFEQIPKAVVEAMRDRGTLCVADIIELKDLKHLDLNGKEMFVIQALEPLVESGIFLDEDISDDPRENHAYRYAHSSKQKKSIDASSDPRFADPDLCD